MVDFASSMYRTPVTCLGDDLFNFLDKSHYSAHLRDIETNKYIFGNLFSTKNIGLKSKNDIVGLTPNEVIAHRLSVENKHVYLSAWEKKLQNLLSKTYALSEKILHEKTEAIQRDIELSITGFIRITQTIRSPVFNTKKQVVAIASVDYDFAQQCELLELFGLYQRYLPEKNAIQNFLRCLDIDHYFYELPTAQELMIILLMCQDSSTAFVTSRLSIPPEAFEAHKANLNRKFSNFDLTHLLISLRTRHESNFDLWD
jgi:hypothetical protein